MDPAAGAAGSSSSRINRTSLERERRTRFRQLFSRLYSLLPPQAAQMSTQQVLERATVYVNQLRNRVEELKQMNSRLEEESKERRGQLSSTFPFLSIIDLDSTLEVNLITGRNGKFQLSHILKILMEEGAQIVTAAADHSAGDTIIYSIHCQPICSRIGIATSRVHERLENWFLEAN
ncbi:hypothetical protein V6N13_012855 [Hibiscus sabdariffa]|uniref:Uncharacterized protein n=2 Tax=Hibiscus sabdariffa TaxID=183260 RepID=A0ABR1ZIG8_9ROSI